MARIFRLHVALAVVTAGIGVYLREPFVLWLALGAALAAACWHTLGGGRTRPATRVRAEDDAVIVRYRRAPVVIFAVGATYLAVWCVASVPLFEAEPLTQAWIGLVALGATIPVPDLVRAALRRSEIRLTRTGMTVSGWSTEAHIDWDDIELIDSDRRNPTAFRLLVRARPGATSYRHRRRRLILALEPWPRPEDIVLHGFSLDDPVLVITFLSALKALTPAERSDLLRSPNAVPFLTRQVDLERLLAPRS